MRKTKRYETIKDKEYIVGGGHKGRGGSQVKKC